jgi:hypothetical protein
MYLTNFMVDSGIKQDALRGRGLASVDVGADANVAVTLDRGLAGHHGSPWTNCRELSSAARAAEFKGSTLCDMIDSNSCSL